MGKAHEVVENELGGRNGQLGAVANHRDLLLRNEGQLVDHALRADLLEHTDDEVGAHDGEKQHVAILAGKEDESRHPDIDGVEEREGVGREDLPDRFGLDVGIVVHAAVGNTRRNLLGREAMQLAIHI